MTSRTGKRLGGMAEILSTAASLGYELENGKKDTSETGQIRQRFIYLLKETSQLQRSLVDLEVEVAARQLEAETAHLTYLEELEKKTSALQGATNALQAIIQNKDRIVARLQQPYSLDSISIETAFQADFQTLLWHAASECGALQRAVEDVRWVQRFEATPTVWQERLESVPAALASCTRYSEALASMRDAIRKVHAADGRTL